MNYMPLLLYCEFIVSSRTRVGPGSLRKPVSDLTTLQTQPGLIETQETDLANDHPWLVSVCPNANQMHSLKCYNYFEI